MIYVLQFIAAHWMIGETVQQLHTVKKVRTRFCVYVNIVRYSTALGLRVTAHRHIQ